MGPVIIQHMIRVVWEELVGVVLFSPGRIKKNVLNGYETFRVYVLRYRFTETNHKVKCRIEC